MRPSPASEFFQLYVVSLLLTFSRLLLFFTMSSMSIPSSIRAISITTKSLPHFNLFPTHSSPLKPLISSFPHSFSSFKSISFQILPTKTQSLSNSSSSSSVQPLEELPPKLQEIIKLFQAAHEPRAKYQQLMFYASNLPPLDEKYKTKENKVEGCVSQVWVRAFIDKDDDDKVYYEADSDSIMTKGLAALLVQGLSGQPISEIVKVSPGFVTLLGLQQNLTPSRNNGFLNMLKLMQRKALFLGFEAEKEEGNSVVSGPEVEFAGVNGSSGLESSSLDVRPRENAGNGLGIDYSNPEPEIGGVNESAGVESSSPDGGGSVNGGSELSLGRRGERIREKLERELKPVELEVEDVSYQHAGHAGVKGSDGETHFNLKVVSNEFEGKSLVKRHRMIYGLLQDELHGGLHALSIIAKTPSEIEESR